MFESWATYYVLGRERQRDILARARLDRMIAGLRPSRAVLGSLRRRIAAWLGRGLVALGTRMQVTDTGPVAAVPNGQGDHDLRRAG